MRKFLFFIVLCVSFLSARVVEIYPSLDTIGRWKISQNIPYYVNLLNFAIINQNGKKVLYPVPTNLTKKFIGKNLVIHTLKMADTTNFLKAIHGISDTQKASQNMFDPINILKRLICKYQDTESSISNCMVKMDTNGYLDDAINSFFMSLLESFLNYKEGLKKLTKEELINYLLKEELAKSGFEHTFAEFLIKNEAAKYVFSKVMDYFIDILFSVNINDVNNISDVVKSSMKLSWAKDLTEDFMGKFTVLMDIANGVVNVGSTTWAINAINNKTDEMNVKAYILDFINDYVYKYNMNINEMAKDCDLSSTKAGKYQVSKNYYHKPYDFFQIFVIYGITHNYLEDIDLFNGKNMYYMWLAAHDALNLIERFGDGGNLKIYIDVNDNKPNESKINDKSYFTNSFYWMLPVDLKENLNIVFGTSVNNINSFYNNLYISMRNYSYYNPYLSRNGIYNFYIKNANVKINNYDITKQDNVEYYYLSASKKVENSEDWKITAYLPIYKIVYNKNDFLNSIVVKSLKLGLIDFEPNLKEKLLNDISYEELRQILYRFSKITSIQELNNKANIDKYLSQIQWTSPITREELFEFLVKILKLNYIFYNNSLMQNFSNNSKCDSTYGCILRKYKISTGNYSKESLKIWQVLVILDRIDNIFTKASK